MISSTLTGLTTTTIQMLPTSTTPILTLENPDTNMLNCQLDKLCQMSCKNLKLIFSRPELVSQFFSFIHKLNLWIELFIIYQEEIIITRDPFFKKKKEQIFIKSFSSSYEGNSVTGKKHKMRRVIKANLQRQLSKASNINIPFQKKQFLNHDKVTYQNITLVNRGCYC